MLIAFDMAARIDIIWGLDRTRAIAAASGPDPEDSTVVVADGKVVDNAAAIDVAEGVAAAAAFV